jgi:D-methionine transport system substrate-binding protein
MLKLIKYLSKILISIIIASNLQAESTITVGASNIPHSEILDFVKPILKKQGINLNVVIFQDYILPNKALANKEIDANYFQHIQYLDSQIKENRGYKFKILAKVHIEPIGLYSKKYSKISDLPQNAKIVTSNSSSDLTRILLLLQSSGLITLTPNQSSYTLNDITTNPKNIQILNSIDSSLLALMYKENEQDAIVINTNYALDAGLNPLKDAIVLESSDSPYVNVLVSREDNAKDNNLQQLAKVLNSKEVQDFIKNKYNGNVLPYKNTKLK